MKYRALLCLLCLFGVNETRAQTSFTNAAVISVPNGTQLSPQKAATYPSTINVSGLTGTISKVTVRLSGISTPTLDPNGINALLVSPTGAKLAFMAHPGDGSVTFNGGSLVFDDGVTNVMPGCNVSTCTAFTNGTTTQTYKPTAWTPPSVPAFPSPAPSSPNLAAPAGSATLASTFNGSFPTGTWSLYLVSDASVGNPSATISGWSLTITTVAGTVPTTTTLLSSPNPSYTAAPNNSVTFTATVRTNGTPITTGTVTFSEGATILAGPTNLNGSGQASFTTNFSAEGTHKITATYNGTASFGASSANLSQTVLTHTTNPSAGEYCNPGPLTIPQSGLTGTPAGDPANPYPSSIVVSGMAGTISKLTVSFSLLAHQHPNDIAMLLVSPGGAAYVIWSAVASGNPIGLNPVNIVLDDSAANQLPSTGSSVANGTYRPAVFNSTIGPAFPAPAPGTFNSAPPYGIMSLADAFNGLNPNGTWSLFVIDDQGGNVGSVAGGWCLTFTISNEKASTTTANSSPNPSFSGTPVTLSATVRDASTLVPVTSGTVTFSEKGAALGAPVSVNASGTAVFNTSSLGEGDHVIKAAYNGSPGNYSVSYATLTQRVDNVTSVTGNKFCDSGIVSISATGALAGQAYPYPSHIFVANSGGPTTKLTLTLNGLAHDFPSQAQMLLVGPDGTQFEFLGHELGNTPISGVTLTLDDAAASFVPGGALSSGTYTYKATSANSSDTFLAPAPAGPYHPASPGGTGTFATLFNGKSADGVWSLFINTLVFGGNGDLSGGWCLTLNTVPILATNPSPQTVCSGTAATFVAAAFGLPAPNVLWQANGGTGFTNIVGATNNTLSFIASTAQNGFTTIP